MNVNDNEDSNNININDNEDSNNRQGAVYQIKCADSQHHNYKKIGKGAKT